MKEALFLDTFEVSRILREHLKREGLVPADNETWTVLLTVQGAVIVGAKPAEKKAA